MKVIILLIKVLQKFLDYLQIKIMAETTKEYFEREKQSRIDLLNYLDTDENLD